MITITIKKDSNMVKYISEIRKYDSMLSIGEIKNNIMNGSPVLTKKLIEYDFSDEFVNNIDPHTRNMMFYDLVKRLLDIGADIIIKQTDQFEEVLDLEGLLREIRMVKEISDDCDRASEKKSVKSQQTVVK